MIATRHQVENADFDNIGLMPIGKSTFYTSSLINYFPEASLSLGTDAVDLVVLDFSDSCEMYPPFKRNFFDFSHKSLHAGYRDSVMICAGVPSSAVYYQYSETLDVGIQRQAFLAKYDGQPSDEYLVRARFIRSLPVDPDGLSGGPVFCIVNFGVVSRVVFMGMMVRAGRDYMHFLRWQYIGHILDLVISKSA